MCLFYYRLQGKFINARNFKQWKITYLILIIKFYSKVVIIIFYVRLLDFNIKLQEIEFIIEPNAWLNQETFKRYYKHVADYDYLWRIFLGESL